MTRKDLLRAVAFILVLCSVIYVLCDLFEHENSLMSRRYETYYSLSKGTVDAIMVGTSGIDRYWMASKAYNDHGITVYPMSTDSQPAWLTTEILDEALKHQDPELVIIDFRPFTVTNTGDDLVQQEVSARRVIDIMDFLSINRLKAIFKTKKIMEILKPDEEQNALEFYFSFIKYHSRWDEDNFTFDELKNIESKFMGFFISERFSIRSVYSFPDSELTDERVPLDPVCNDAFEEVLEYVQGKDFEVLFLDTPHYLTYDESGRMNTMRDRLDELGIKYKCYSMEDNVLNITRDFYNDGHANFYGAQAFTDEFASYLLENYQLEDRRGDKNTAKDWDGTYDNILEKIELLEYVAHLSRTPVFSSLENPAGVTVSWYPIDNATGYQVWRNTEPGGHYTHIATLRARKLTSYVDETAEEGQTYYYMVRAYKSNFGFGTFSIPIKVTVKRYS